MSRSAAVPGALGECPAYCLLLTIHPDQEPRLTSPARFFLPGPTAVHPDVLEALLGPMISHRGPAMEELQGRMEAPLRALFRTREPVLIGSCSATGFMEAAIRSGVDQRVMVLVGGAFGERFARIAERCGKEVIRAVVPEGKILEPDQLDHFLEGPEVDAVALVHSETSTGALAPLQQLAQVVRARPGVLLLVDAASSLGGSPVETDGWGLDFVFTGSQKALALPPGLALGVASARLLERAERLPDRGRYFDLPAYHEAALRHQPLATPALPLYYALDRQLRRIATEGGVEARWRRHRELQAAVESWVARHPAIGFLPAEGRRSWTVSCLQVASGRKAETIVTRLAERGWTIGAGYGQGGLRDTTIRIGHMGEASVEELGELLGEIESLLN